MMQLPGNGSAQQRANAQTANELSALADIHRPNRYHLRRELRTRTEITHPQPLSGIEHRRYATFPYWNCNPFHTALSNSSSYAGWSSHAALPH
jgi:hypothetical protein